MLNTIIHLMLSTNDKKSLVDFYHNKLGLELKNPNDPIFTLSFPNNGPNIGFIEKSEELDSNNRIEITFQVDSVREEIKRLEGNGIEFWRGFTKVAEGLHVANFRDPDGNELSILSFGEE